MFDDNTKQAWQSIQPSAGLKEKALGQTPKKVTAFPANLVKTAAAVAACLIIGVHVLGLGTSLVEVNGQPVIGPVDVSSGPVAATAFSREMPATEDGWITVKLTVEEGTELTVNGGTLDGSVWTVPNQGEYLLRAIKGNRTQYFRLSCDPATGIWTLRPES